MMMKDVMRGKSTLEEEYNEEEEEEEEYSGGSIELEDNFRVNRNLNTTHGDGVAFSPTKP